MSLIINGWAESHEKQAISTMELFLRIPNQNIMIMTLGNLKSSSFGVNQTEK